jgi:hypothetical protein
MQDQNPRIYNLEEIRKKYPRAGRKWEADEDEKLKKAYEEKRAAGFSDFDSFVGELSQQFQRAAGGLKARMAMHFNDVPGWDYSRKEQRLEELNRLVEEKITEASNALLIEEYQKYLSSKKETYISLLRRLSGRLGGVEGKFITHRLIQLQGNIEKYRLAEVNPYGFRPRRAFENKEPEILKIDFSQNFHMQEAWRIMEETTHNLFLTGEAGTGKSTLLKYFRHTTKKNLVVLAPTGVAALNVEGQTIHSFCGFGPDVVLSKVKKLGPSSGKFQLIQKMQTIVIDEISMVRADLLDCVDKFLRMNGPVPSLPFGGIQMVFIGDLYQLPPVDKDFVKPGSLISGYKSPYFFDSRSFSQAKFAYVQLKTIYRQQDPVFISILNAIRNNAATEEHLGVLNTRTLAGSGGFKFEKFAIYLTPTNNRARQVNNFFLDTLKSGLKRFEGVATGNFVDRELPTDLSLEVKPGAQVMMLNNDRQKRWVNGTMGKILEIKKFETKDLQDTNYCDEEETGGDDAIVVELETGEIVEVFPHTWEMFQFYFDKGTQSVDSRTAGTFTQYPLKLAWALTIHKAQGKTFDKVYVDLATGTFAHGQLYVALSRCRILEGINLKRPVRAEDIILDNRVIDFIETFSQKEN